MTRSLPCAIVVIVLFVLITALITVYFSNISYTGSLPVCLALNKRAYLVYHSLFLLSSTFFNFFQKFFLSALYPVPSWRQLYHLTTFFPPCQVFFLFFLKNICTQIIRCIYLCKIPISLFGFLFGSFLKALYFFLKRLIFHASAPCERNHYNYH